MNNNHPLLDDLNPAQTEAVSADAVNALILAGAGSGKTRVLVHRIAWVIREHQCRPSQVLAVTFTNKAAAEMRTRIEALLHQSLQSMWVGTFHGLSHRLLRAHWQEADLPESFQIIDSDDQYRLIRRLQKSLNLDESKWPYKQTQWFINQQKEQARRASETESLANGFFDETLAGVYRLYEQTCQQSGLVDFAELLLRALELLEKNESIRNHYQQRFQYLLVDEFQDTNALQYRWLSALKSPDNVIAAVGDDDQSIYSWRGARVENIQRFQEDFNPMVVMLEQNYRSTQTILTAANTVIENNRNRTGKRLWTDGDSGEAIDVYAAYNDRDETHYLVSAIERELARGNRAEDIAILYRSNAQSRILEERLIETGVPYRIYGGQRFFERAEIKDALAYLRLLFNPLDDAAFERVVNLPTRGIGNTTQQKLRDHAKSSACSLWQAVTEITQEGKLLSARANNALIHFQDLIQSLQTDSEHLALEEIALKAIQGSGLLDHYKKDNSEKGRSRVENLHELINAAEQFTPPADAISTPLGTFLSQVALDAGEGQAAEHTNTVSLMTLHAAKGLEFPIVFISGMEEGLFPHKMSIDQPGGLEEERRLCYVGMTRAMQKLTISYAESRRLHGQERYCQPSRFLQELPDDCLNHIRPQSHIGRAPLSHLNHAFDNQAIGESGLELGQRIAHNTFGSGTITNQDGHGDNTRIEVQFDRFGKKWLVLRYCNVVPID